MRPAYRYALAAVVATTLAVGVGAWLAAHPPPPRVEVRARAPDAPPPAPPATPGDRAAVLDDLEQREAAELGTDEAARRRRLRERMLDARAGHDHE